MLSNQDRGYRSARGYADQECSGGMEGQLGMSLWGGVSGENSVGSSRHNLLQPDVPKSLIWAHSITFISTFHDTSDCLWLFVLRTTYRSVVHAAFIAIHTVVVTHRASIMR